MLCHFSHQIYYTLLCFMESFILAYVLYTWTEGLVSHSFSVFFKKLDRGEEGIV